jgi:hypothetical protein
MAKSRVVTEGGFCSCGAMEVKGQQKSPDLGSGMSLLALGVTSFLQVAVPEAPVHSNSADTFPLMGAPDTALRLAGAGLGVAGQITSGLPTTSLATSRMLSVRP